MKLQEVWKTTVRGTGITGKFTGKLPSGEKVVIKIEKDWIESSISIDGKMLNDVSRADITIEVNRDTRFILDLVKGDNDLEK